LGLLCVLKKWASTRNLNDALGDYFALVGIRTHCLAFLNGNGATTRPCFNGISRSFFFHLPGEKLGIFSGLFIFISFMHWTAVGPTSHASDTVLAPVLFSDDINSFPLPRCHSTNLAILVIYHQIAPRCKVFKKLYIVMSLNHVILLNLSFIIKLLQGERFFVINGNGLSFN
jgi:hypothetical protein